MVLTASPTPPGRPADQQPVFLNASVLTLAPAPVSVSGSGLTAIEPKPPKSMLANGTSWARAAAFADDHAAAPTRKQHAHPGVSRGRTA